MEAPPIVTLGDEPMDEGVEDATEVGDSELLDAFGFSGLAILFKNEAWNPVVPEVNWGFGPEAVI